MKRAMLANRSMSGRPHKIPISVIVVTKNEERRVARCLDALSDFSEVIIVDSMSDDKTREIAATKGARVVQFTWNGQYPKKRGWCLAHLDTAHDWILWIDGCIR